jgi:hypothetical protein
MKIYYLQAEYEPGKHRIMKIWSSKFIQPRPEENINEAINVPYSIVEFDEDWNRDLAREIVGNYRFAPDGQQLPDKFYVDNSGDIRLTDTDALVTPTPNPYTESFKLSAIHGLTQAQLETYIDNNVIDLASAKEFLKKLSAVVLWLVKHTNLE